MSWNVTFGLIYVMTCVTAIYVSWYMSYVPCYKGVVLTPNFPRSRRTRISVCGLPCSKTPVSWPFSWNIVEYCHKLVFMSRTRSTMAKGAFCVQFGRLRVRFKTHLHEHSANSDFFIVQVASHPIAKFAWMRDSFTHHNKVVLVKYMKLKKKWVYFKLFASSVVGCW